MGETGREQRCLKREGGTLSEAVFTVPEEIAFTLIVNGRNVATAMLSPGMLHEFTLGYLFTEQIVKGTGEIESVRLERNAAEVLLKNPFRLVGQRRMVPGGCGGSSSPLETRRLPKIRSGAGFSAGEIQAAVERMIQVHEGAAASGLHFAGIAERGRVIAIAQDIGSLHALDKAIGHALREQIALPDKCLITSGSISSGAVRKCLVSNIPVIASPGAATALAIELAEAGGLTIACQVHNASMVLCSHPERIAA